MRDHIEHRLWADHGHQFSAEVRALFRGAAHSLRRLHALRWDAPWRAGEAAAERSAGAPRMKLAGLAVSLALATVAATLTVSGAAAPAGATLI